MNAFTGICNDGLHLVTRPRRGRIDGHAKPNPFFEFTRFWQTTDQNQPWKYLPLLPSRPPKRTLSTQSPPSPCLTQSLALPPSQVVFSISYAADKTAGNRVAHIFLTSPPSSTFTATINFYPPPSKIMSYEKKWIRRLIIPSVCICNTKIGTDRHCKRCEFEINS